MDTNSLYHFKSHVSGKNADVNIFVDRIEWLRDGGMSKGKALGALATGGMSIVATGLRHKGGSEMIPVKSMTSVMTERDGLVYWKVTVTASGNSVDFRCTKLEAEQAKSVLTQLMLGTHPTQVKSSVSPSPVPARESTSTTGVAEEIKKLAELRDAGILTAEEFAAQKTKLLGT